MALVSSEYALRFQGAAAARVSLIAADD